MNVLLYRRWLWRSGVYPPQQSASWYNWNRLLDFGHVICFVVLCTVILLLETIIFSLAVKHARSQIKWLSQSKYNRSMISITLYHYSSHGSVTVSHSLIPDKQPRRLQLCLMMSRGRKHERNLITMLQSKRRKDFSHIFQLLVSLFLQLLVGLVDLRVHAPQALGPLSINNAVFLFAGQRGRQGGMNGRGGRW